MALLGTGFAKGHLGAMGNGNWHWSGWDIPNFILQKVILITECWECSLSNCRRAESGVMSWVDGGRQRVMILHTCIGNFLGSRLGPGFLIFRSCRCCGLGLLVCVQCWSHLSLCPVCELVWVVVVLWVEGIIWKWLYECGKRCKRRGVVVDFWWIAKCRRFCCNPAACV